MASALWRQENSPLRACALPPSCSRSTGSDSSRSSRQHHFVVVVDEQAGHAVDDRVGQAAGGPVADRRHAVLSGLGDREAPALLARRQHVHPTPLQHLVFRRHRRRGRGRSPRRRPRAVARGRRGARATSRHRRCRGAGPAFGGAVRRRRRARPRSACAAPACSARRPAACPTGAASSVSGGASSSPLRTTAMCSASTPRSVRSRADGSDTVTYWLRRCSHGDNRDSTNQPKRPFQRPATGHSSRWQ